MRMYVHHMYVCMCMHFATDVQMYAPTSIADCIDVTEND